MCALCGTVSTLMRIGSPQNSLGVTPHGAESRPSELCGEASSQGLSNPVVRHFGPPYGLLPPGSVREKTLRSVPVSRYAVRTSLSNVARNTMILE